MTTDKFHVRLVYMVNVKGTRNKAEYQDKKKQKLQIKLAL